MAVAAVVAGAAPGSSAAAGTAVAEAPSPGFDDGLSFRTAQHIHARGSEGPASMTAQAAEAAKHVQAMFFTDHDWREAAVGAPATVHFNSLTDEVLPPNQRGWVWEPRTSGTLAASDGGILTGPQNTSPRDPDPTGALFARAVSAGRRPATFAFFANDNSLRKSMRTPVSGQTWSIDVKLDEASRTSYGLLRVQLSYHPADPAHDRPADAYYYLEYRFGPFPKRGYAYQELDMLSGGGADDGGDDGGPGQPALLPGEKAIVGIVKVPHAGLGVYRTHTLTFTRDIERLFPGMIARDNSVRGLWLGATSTQGAPARATFDYLRMSRTTGQPQLDDRRAITAELQQRFPGVRLLNGVEYSYGTDGGHRHGLGGDLRLPDFPPDLPAAGGTSSTDEELVAAVLAAGGMPIANHPFGANGKALTQAQAEFRARDYVARLKANNAEGGLQGLETYYRTRGGATLEHHLFLAYTAVRNGLVLTLSGVSDNHWGRNGSWIEERNHFVTGVFAATTAEQELIEAMRRGRAYTAEIGSYDGRIDLAFDDGDTPVVMGQVDVRPGTVSRRLRILASALPADGVVEVHQIPVDGSMDGSPGGVIQVLPASRFQGGRATVTVPTDRDSAFTVHVATQASASGPVKRIGGSNPIWHLNAEPTSWTIPERRRAGG